MISRVLLIFSVALMVLGCEKNKFTTAPKITIKSVEPDVVPRSGTLVITLGFTDLEGDISDTLFLRKEIQNLNQPGRILQTKHKIPNFPTSKNQEGEIVLDLNYFAHIGNPLTAQNDTIIYKIWIKDLAGNRSDTVTTQQIVILR